MCVFYSEYVNKILRILLIILLVEIGQKYWNRLRVKFMRATRTFEYDTSIRVYDLKISHIYYKFGIYVDCGRSIRILIAFV